MTMRTRALRPLMLITSLFVLLGLAAAPAVGQEGENSGAPTIDVLYQVESTHVQVDRVVSPEPAWLAIRSVTDTGDPGEVVGYRKVPAGETTEFEVEAQLLNVPGNVYKMVFASLYKRDGELNSNSAVQNQPLLQHDGETITALFSVCKHVYQDAHD